MKPTNRIPLLVCLALLFLVSTSAFTAANPQDDKIVFGGTYVLFDGETLTGNLVILGGAVTLEQNSTVNGDTALIGGTLDADGRIKGNLTVIGGTARLASQAVVSGDVFTLGGALDRSPDSQVLGEVTNFTAAPFSLDIPGVPIRPDVPVLNFYQSPVSLLWKVIYLIGMVIFTAALAMLIALLWAKPTQRVANAIRTNPIGTGGFGCLTLIVAPGLLVLLAITIFLSPLSLLGMLLLAGAVIFGWVAINLEVGNRLARLFKVEWSAPIAAGIGALVFNLVIFVLGNVPCLGLVLDSLVVLFALGGVLITRFGTHDYPEVPATPVRPVVQVAPAVIAPPAPITPAAVKPVVEPKAPPKAQVSKPAPAAAPKAKTTPPAAKTAAKATGSKPAAKPKSK
jgi:hypothetical protein